MVKYQISYMYTDIPHSHLSISLKLRNYRKWPLYFCYGLSACISPKFVCWSLKPPCNGIKKWGHWEIIWLDKFMRMESWWWAECFYMKRKRHQSWFSLPCEDTARRQTSESKGEKPEKIVKYLSTLILDFQSSDLWENRTLLFKPPVCKILL